VNSPAVTPNEVAGLISSLQADSHRWQLDWQDVEVTPPVDGVHKYDFSTYDRMYNADLADGIRPLIFLVNAPSWAWAADVPRVGQGWGFPPDASHMSDWRAFCAAVAGHYPKAVGLEIWNEPNYPRFWGRGFPQQMPNPAGYTDLLKNAYQAIKSENPNMRVVGGALSPLDSGGPVGSIPLREFAEELFADGGANYMDAFSIHSYPRNPTLSGPRLFEWAIDQARAAEAAAGVDKQLWLTEFGITTSGPTGVSRDKQAKSLTDFVNWVGQQADIGAYYVHTLTEETQDETNAEKGFALLSGASYPFSPKPAFEALQRLNDEGTFHSPIATSPLPQSRQRKTSIRLRHASTTVVDGAAGSLNFSPTKRGSRLFDTLRDGIGFLGAAKIVVRARGQDGDFTSRTLTASVHG
jgi:hypothetical protein